MLGNSGTSPSDVCSKVPPTENNETSLRHISNGSPQLPSQHGNLFMQHHRVIHTVDDLI